MITPLKQQETIGLQIESVIREMIIRGEFPPGTRLNEVKIAAQFGVSRGPLREAIRRLAAEGLLTLVTHRGAHVRTFEPSELVQLYELREVLETSGCQLAATRATNEQLAELADLLSSTQSHLTGGEKTYPLGLDFHQAVMNMSGNEALAAAAQDVNRKLYLARATSAHVPERARQAYAEHMKVLAALEARDPKRAKRLMQAHLQRSADHALAALRPPKT